MIRAGRAPEPLPCEGAGPGVGCATRHGDRPHYVCVVLPPIEPYSLSGGAIATVVRNVAHQWERAGHAVTVITPAGDTPPYRVGRPVVLDATHGPGLFERLSARIGRAPRWDWSGYRHYLKAVTAALQSLDGAPDVLVAHNDLQILSELAHLVPGAETVLWLHNEISTARPDPGLALQGIDRIVAVSDYVARWTEDHYGLAAGTVRTAHNGVDLEQFHPVERARQPGSSLRVVCHGRIDPGKGFHLVVDAVARLRSHGLHIDLTLAGALQAFGITAKAASAYRDSLLSSVADIGGTYRGRLPPDQVPHLLREADVACAPSVHPEPFGLSALEALASGCALVASSRGGLPEAAGSAGLLFDPDDPDALTDALHRLATDPVFLAERQWAARAQAEQFPWSVPAAVALGRDPRSSPG